MQFSILIERNCFLRILFGRIPIFSGRVMDFFGRLPHYFGLTYKNIQNI